MKRKDTGRLGERLARAYLEERGYLVLETNYRTPAGEIDIIARQGECLVFVEVRTKRSGRFGSAEESLTSRKQQHLIDSAALYCQSCAGPAAAYRIDFIAVALGGEGLPVRIRHLENAVTES